MERKIIAIDFDGCISLGPYPELGPPNMALIEEAIKEQENGAALILWTCRVDKELEQAVEFCRDHGLVFDAVNENIPELIEAFGTDCRKVSATEYWDDRAVFKGDGRAYYGEMIWFSQRSQISRAFRAWAKDSKVAPSISNFVAFLVVHNAVKWNPEFLSQVKQYEPEE